MWKLEVVLVGVLVMDVGVVFVKDWSGDRVIITMLVVDISCKERAACRSFSFGPTAALPFEAHCVKRVVGFPIQVFRFGSVQLFDYSHDEKLMKEG